MLQANKLAQEVRAFLAPEHSQAKNSTFLPTDIA